ncbi:hypothetical protein RhiirA4_483840 [Rhizophagus irregularis]|uniref:Uncharacterized protein n=1 Tax=Rhizophagus irregularis TaxID=588596 RepID=A0A2I1HN29_9GLOM|nr:hypothetical protein RhiirA4_483840 [Rhizophagus irregularis]
MRYMEDNFSDTSRDIAFMDEEIYEYIRDVGYVEQLKVKRCYKYNTIKANIRFTKDYEQIFLRGGSNIIVVRNSRQYFCRMFDSKLTPCEISEKFRWQAIRKS